MFLFATRPFEDQLMHHYRDHRFLQIEDIAMIPAKEAKEMLYHMFGQHFVTITVSFRKVFRKSTDRLFDNAITE